MGGPWHDGVQGTLCPGNEAARGGGVENMGGCIQGQPCTKICDADNLNKNQTYHLDNTDEPLSWTDYTYGNDPFMAELTFMMSQESKKEEVDNLTVWKTAHI